MIKCVLFDMDGTLSDTLDDLTVALNVMLKFYKLPSRTRDEVRGMVGNGIDALIYRGLPDTHKHLFDEGCGDIFRAYYKAHLTDYTRPYDGVNEVIDALKAKGIKIGIVSNKLQAPLEEIVYSFWGDKIDTVVGITDALPSKPHADMVYACLKGLECNLEDAIYVGDSLVDLQTANNAKARFIACSWGFATKEALIKAGASEIIDHPSEVLNYID
ncbi:MAG: HAD family hydrolase [Clostridia bacterium]|nr:HAD family hydrolase [Clostridia bacterium]